MDVSSVLFWLYIVPLIVILVPGTLAFSRLGDMEGVISPPTRHKAVFVDGLIQNAVN